MLRIHADIVINAPIETVWDVLVDFPQYECWNPFIPFAHGVAETGARLDIIIAPPGLNRGRYHLEILDVEPQRSLRWLGHMFLSGLMDGDHVFELHGDVDDRTRLIQREKFSGMLVPFMRPWLKRCLTAGFMAMNQALKQRAEALPGQSQAVASHACHPRTPHSRDEDPRRPPGHGPVICASPDACGDDAILFPRSSAIR
jgi:hypothetical protein